VVALDVHKFSIVAAVLPPAGGRPEVCEQAATGIRLEACHQRLVWLLVPLSIVP
jgi:hypothetical protein